MLTGSAAEDRFSVPNPSKIRKAELTALNTKTLAPRKHLEPLKYLLENNYFHEDARECILSILSVMELKKGTNKGLCKLQKKKAQKPQKSSKGQKSLFDIWLTKKYEDEKVVGERNNLKNIAVLHDSSEKSYEDGSFCSDSGGSESDCKN